MASRIADRREPDRGLLETVSEAFRAAGLQGAIIGGIARNHWEIPRVTFDLDLTVKADAEAIAYVIAALADRGFEVLRNQAPDEASGPDFIQLYNREIAQVVELQTAKTPFQEELLRRAVPLDDSGLHVATREDLIVLKLLALRSKDQDDLRELAGHDTVIDWAYVEHWCNEWAIGATLEQFRSRLAEENR